MIKTRIFEKNAFPEILFRIAHDHHVTSLTLNHVPIWLLVNNLIEIMMMIMKYVLCDYWIYLIYKLNAFKHLHSPEQSRLWQCWLYVECVCKFLYGEIKSKFIVCNKSDNVFVNFRLIVKHFPTYLAISLRLSASAGGCCEIFCIYLTFARLYKYFRTLKRYKYVSTD